MARSGGHLEKRIMVGIKACPFCGSKNIKPMIASIEDIGGDSYCMECCNCGAEGPWLKNKTEAQAIEKWNRRVK